MPLLLLVSISLVSWGSLCMNNEQEDGWVVQLVPEMAELPVLCDSGKGSCSFWLMPFPKALRRSNVKYCVQV